MNVYELYYKEYEQHSINAVCKKVKGNYLYIDKNNDILLIDNVKKADLKDLQQIRFLVKGYYQVINL